MQRKLKHTMHALSKSLAKLNLHRKPGLGRILASRYWFILSMLGMGILAGVVVLGGVWLRGHSAALPPLPKPEVTLSTHAGPFTLSAAKDVAKNGILVSLGQGETAFVPLEHETLGPVNKVEATPSGEGKLTYPNLYNGVDLIYTLSKDKVLEEYEVKSQRKVTSLSQKLDTRELEVTKLSDGSLGVYTKGGVALFGKKPLSLIPKPVMYEKHNKAKRSYALHWEVETKEDGTYLTKVVEPEGLAWMRKASYPIMVDGTLVTDPLTLESLGVSLSTWSIRLDTIGRENLTITPSPAASFVSLTCGGETVTTTLGAGGKISAANYACSEATVVSYTLSQPGNYTISASFGGTGKQAQVTYQPESQGPVFTEISQSPLFVQPGQTITVTASITDPSGVASASAKLGNDLPTIPLTLSQGSETNGTWVGAWVAEGTGPIAYQTYITATNRNGVASTSDPIDWSDWSDLGGGDHGGADWTIGNGTSISGTHTNIGALVIDAGSTVSVQAYNGSSYGSVSIAAVSGSISGTLTATGKGYPSDTGTGAGGSHGFGGSGGGHGGRGADGFSAGGGTYYGSASAPTTMGSGGGSSAFGAGSTGGGVVRIITSNTLTVSGVVNANGNNGIAYTYGTGGGAGGSIYLTTAAFAGSGSITANGGNGANGASGTGGAGGGGRIMVYFSTSKTFSGTMTANVGTIGTSGEPGSTMIEDSSNHDLWLTGNNTWRTGDRSITFRNITTGNNMTWSIKPTSLSVLTVSATGTVTFGNTVNTYAYSYTSGNSGVGVKFNVGSLTLPSSSSINSNSLGFAGAAGPGAGGGSGFGGGGGGYGGRGADGFSGGGGAVNGSSTSPVSLGSGGGNGISTVGGPGGGSVQIYATGTVTVNGTISSNGSNSYGALYPGGGGSGGSVYITTGTFTGGGTISANGGNGHAGGGTSGGGGGGRIAIYYSASSTWSGSTTATKGTLGTSGADGTILTSPLYLWDGEGTDGSCGGLAGDGNKWSCGANWSFGSPPGASDFVLFNSTSTKNAMVDSGFGGSIANLWVYSGYTGTINLARSLAVSKDYEQTTGTFDSANQTLSVGGNFTVSGGTFTPGTGTLSLSGTTYDTTFSSTQTGLNHVTVDKSGKTVTLANSIATNNFTLSNGTMANPSSGYTLSVAGNFLMAATTTMGGANLPISFTGSNTQTFSKTGGTLSSPFTVNKSGGSLSLGSNITAGSACTVTNGTFFLNGKNFTCGSTFTVQSGGALSLIGNEISTSPTLNTGSTVEYKGDGDLAPDVYAVKNWSYSNLTINLTDSNDSINTSSGTFIDRLIAYWPMDEPAGTQVSDASGNGYTGTATGTSIETNTKKYGSGARRMNGAAGNYISIPGLTWTPTSFSVAFWLYPDSRANYNQQLLSAVGWSGFVFHTASDGSIYTGTDSTNRFSNTQLPANSLTTGSWQFFVFTYDGSQGRFYKGTSQLSTAKTMNPSAAWTGGFRIGATNTDTINGVVDEVRIFSKALSLSEITEIYNNSENSISGLTVGNNLTISSGTFNAPASLTIGGNLTNNGTFTHNSGTVVFNDASKPSVLSGSGSPALTFFNLSSTTPGKTITFTGGETFRVNGLLTLTGAAKNWVNLGSTNTSQWVINHQGTESISYASVKNSGCEAGTTDITAGSTSRDLGNNGTCWLFSSPPIDVRVGGTMRVSGNTRVGGDQ